MAEYYARRSDQVLIRTDDDFGFIYELGSDVRYPEQNINSILARGHWKEPSNELSEDRIEEIVKLPVKERV